MKELQDYYDEINKKRFDKNISTSELLQIASDYFKAIKREVLNV